MNKSSLPHRSAGAFIVLILTICALGAVASAQTPTYIWTPPNAQTLPGSAEPVPFNPVSATFQQVHEPESMGNAIVLKGMALRNWGKGTTKGRSWDLRLTLSHTSTTAQKATTTFATNLGTNNTTIVFGSATTWPTFSFKDFTSTSTVSPPTFTIPFSSPYVYVPQLGSLCWEWRHKNNTSTAAMYMDVVHDITHRGTIVASTGAGCTATGNTMPATAKVTTPLVTGVGYHYQLDLNNATSSAAAALAIGLTKNSQNIGWCSKLELNPLTFVTGQTDAQGNWSIQVPLLSLAGLAASDIHTQFGFTDTGLPAGIGLSNLASYKTPDIPGTHGMALIYKYNGSKNGGELATSGTLIKAYGFVTGWLQ